MTEHFETEFELLFRTVTFRKTGPGWIRTNLAIGLQCPSNPSVA
jgi:hypothetical protein